MIWHETTGASVLNPDSSETVAVDAHQGTVSLQSVQLLEQGPKREPGFAGPGMPKNWAT